MDIKKHNQRGVGFVLAMCGGIGVALVLLVNLIAWLILAKAGARPFADDWWTLWAQNYGIWLVIGAAGLLVWAFTPRRD